MTPKEPVLLTILVDTQRLRWHVAGISADGSVSPLLVSHDDDLAAYRTLDFDEQTSFLRHRFCGTVQRGSDRLWGLKKKAAHFVFVLDGVFPDAPEELTTRVAEHLVQWMTKPPVTFFQADAKTNALSPIAGDLPADWSSALDSGLSPLRAATAQTDLWEIVPLRTA